MCILHVSWLLTSASLFILKVIFCVFLCIFSCSDSSLCFDTVGWVIWPVKTRPRYNLLCVWWDVKPCSVSQSVLFWVWHFDGRCQRMVHRFLRHLHLRCLQMSWLHQLEKVPSKPWLHSRLFPAHHPKPTLHTESPLHHRIISRMHLLAVQRGKRLETKFVQVWKVTVSYDTFRVYHIIRRR